jgi:hypothetical protein
MSHEGGSAECESCLLRILKLKAVKGDKKERKITKEGLRASVARLSQPKMFKSQSVVALDCKEDLKK